MGRPVNYERALPDPASAFSTPEEVLEHPGLTEQQKTEILRRWKHDAAEVAVAEEEGMVGDAPLILRPILLALGSLTGGTGIGPTAPTKRGGV